MYKSMYIIAHVGKKIGIIDTLVRILEGKMVDGDINTVTWFQMGGCAYVTYFITFKYSIIDFQSQLHSQHIDSSIVYNYRTLYFIFIES